MKSVFFVLALFLLIVLLEVRYRLFFLKKYQNRKSTEKYWKETFPDTPEEEIKKFLNIFANSFAIGNKNKINFEPNDRLIEIYKQLYPLKWIPDVLEFETLAADIEKEYGVSFDEIWHDNLTLGDLFKKVKTQ